jgi:hypothetical protein
MQEADENEEAGKVIHDQARSYFRKMEDGMLLNAHHSPSLSLKSLT